MEKAKCAMCSREINQNEHFFVAIGRTLCRECGLKIKAKRTEVRGNGSGIKGNGSGGSSLASVEC